MHNDEYSEEDEYIEDEDTFEEDEIVDGEESIADEDLDVNDEFAEDESDEFEEDDGEDQVNIEDLDTMDIPSSGFSPEERRAEYRRRGQSPSGVIDGIYNDTQCPPGVPYNDSNRDWEAGA